jgi:hypothetical protein
MCIFVSCLQNHNVRICPQLHIIKDHKDLEINGMCQLLIFVDVY